jgi:hypothetical protein
MRRFLILAVFLAGTAVAFNLGRRVPVAELPAPDSSGSGGADLGGSVEPRPQRLEAARLATLRAINADDTYLPAMLAESDSILRRWVNREVRPLRVYFEPATAPGYTAAMGRVVRDAFPRWRRAGGIPVRFDFVRSPDDVDVIVRFIEAFDARRAGQADLVWRSDGHLQQGTLTLATHSHLGRPFSTEAVGTVALHEIGHLLGLGHSDLERDVMYPTTSVHDLTSRDRKTAMLLYSLPPGSLKGPPSR